MRLGALFLSAAAIAAAQAPGSLPWSTASVLPWTAGPCPAPAPLTAAANLNGLTLTVHLSQDGALRINDDKGILRLRLGLPGRPMKLWRDGGTPVAPGTQTLRFPAQALLSGGLGALPVGAPEFRPSLEGLLWILDDDEKFITWNFPATAQAVCLPLPGGRNLSLVFLPDRLAVQSTAPDPQPPGEDVCWSVPWLALLPKFIQLSQQDLHLRPEGSVLLPFPRE